MHVRNDLTLFVRRHVSDFVGNIHVPMDALGGARRRVAAAGIDEHTDLSRGICFVAGVVRENLKLGPIKLLGPVTLLAGFCRRAQIVNRSGDGTRIGVKSGREYLACPGKLGFHVPGGASSDVTVNATDAGVWRQLIRGEFRGHDSVAELPAELYRIRKLVSSIT